MVHLSYYFFPKLRVHMKDNNNSPHGKFHWFLFPFSSKFPDLNFAPYVFYIYPCYEPVSDTKSEPGLPVWKRGCKSSFHVPDVTPLGGTKEELGIHLDCWQLWHRPTLDFSSCSTESLFARWVVLLSLIIFTIWSVLKACLHWISTRLPRIPFQRADLERRKWVMRCFPN